MSRRISPGEFGTHIAPLLTAVLNTTGDVFEMGSGDWSTPFLHALCAKEKRTLLTADTDKEWLSHFADLARPWHKLVHVELEWAWDYVGDQKWGVVFVDHKPGDRRIHDIVRFKDKAQVIVVHDTENPGYGYEHVFKFFKYRYDYKRYNVWTTLVSNHHGVSEWFRT